MVTRQSELERRVAELEAAQARAEILYQISRDLNTARDEDELLQVLARPAREAGVQRATLWYIDLDQSGEAEWLKLVAHWEQTGEPRVQVGTRYYAPTFSIASLWLSTTHKALLITDVSSDARLNEIYRENYAAMDTQTSVIIPMTQGGQRVGLFIFNWTERHEFSELETAIYHALVDLAPPAVAAHRMAQDARTRAEELAVLNELSQALTTRLTVDEVLAEAYKQSSRLIDASNFFVGLYNHDKHEIVFPINISASEIDQEVKVISADDGLSGYIVRNRANLLFEDNVREHERALGVTSVGVEAQSWLGVPLIVGDNVLGVMGVHSHTTPRLYGKHEQELLLAIASPTAIALQNARMIESLELVVEERTAELRQSLNEREQLQQKVIDAQQQALGKLSTPIIPIMDTPQGGIIVMPLIGSIDTMRARDITRSLLAGVREHRAKVVILDITGVPVVDSGVANYLNKTIQAARLKGAHTVVTGISDAVAETIVELGIDWSGIETLPDLQMGLRVALARLGQRIKG